jgi:hypothetical protein
MNTSTCLRRFSRLLILSVSIAGASASGAAGAVGRPPDVSDAATANATVPDVFERYTATHPYGGALPDVFERYAAAHPYGSGLSTRDVQPPDIRDTATAIVGPSPVERSIAQERARHGDPAVFGPGSSTAQLSPVVVRPPDVRDAAEAATTASTGGGDRFDWGDYAIGIGSGIGLSLLLAGALGAGLQRRGRVQTA